MEQINNTTAMLDLINHSAFCVKDGIVVGTNQAARQHTITEGTAIADLLLTFQIILRHMLHGDHCVFKVFDLSPEGFPAFKSGVENNKDQYGGHDDHVDNDNKNLFHALSSHKNLTILFVDETVFS